MRRVGLYTGRETHSAMWWLHVGEIQGARASECFGHNSTTSDTVIRREPPNILHQDLSKLESTWAMFCPQAVQGMRKIELLMESENVQYRISDTT